MTFRALEGRLRDMGLAEVLQLLAIGRKSGTLACEAPLHGRHVRIVFHGGLVADAIPGGPAAPPSGGRDRKAVEELVLDVLQWRDGHFHFEASSGTPADGMVRQPTPPAGTAVDGGAIRVAIEPLLLESVRREEGWARIRPLIPHARLVPSFSAMDGPSAVPEGLPPVAHDLMARVDGVRTIFDIAALLEADQLTVAEAAHDLVAAGVLVVRDRRPTPRFNPTPPSMPAIRDEPDEDSLFDPAAHGLQFVQGRVVQATRVPARPVAPDDHGPSVPDRRAPQGAPQPHGPTLCRLGDERARVGDLLGAVTFWQAALRAPVPVADPDRLREAVALASRLHAVLYP
jgi:hypothetical protein